MGKYVFMYLLVTFRHSFERYFDLLLTFSLKYVHVCLYVGMCMSVLTDTRGTGFPLELELQVVVSHLILVLRTKLKSSGK